jgi:hypothetical protein
MLKHYKEKKPAIYRNIIDSFRKGALGISDEELKEIDYLHPRLPDEGQEALRQFVVAKAREKRRKKHREDAMLDPEEKTRPKNIRMAILEKVIDEMVSKAFVEQAAAQNS